MAAKIKLGAVPKSFKKTVEADLLDGTTGSLEIEYIYRTRKEFGEFIDTVVDTGTEKAKAEAAAIPEGEAKAFSQVELMQLTTGANADYLLGVMKGWSLDVPLNRENLMQLCDELPAVAAAIMNTYRAACVEGRLGN